MSLVVEYMWLWFAGWIGLSMISVILMFRSTKIVSPDFISSKEFSIVFIPAFLSSVSFILFVISLLGFFLR